jgi:hypothetical protein
MCKMPCIRISMRAGLLQDVSTAIGIFEGSPLSNISSGDSHRAVSAIVGLGSRLRHSATCARAMLSVAAFLAVSLCYWAGLWAKEPSEEDIRFFETKIRPVLVEHCYECHGPKKQQAGLRLDSRRGWQQGGDSGPAIVPGDPEASRLWRALRYDDVELQMPPDGKLPDRVIEAFAEWIRRGAPDPRESPEESAGGAVQRAASSSHWAYQIPRRPEVPEEPDDRWSWTPVDRFVWQQLRQHGMEPAPDAPPQVLIRRLYFDLIGLPPTPEELQQFLDQPSRQAYEQLVDRLLSSPRFGERWARHWLDVVRYAESLTLRGFLLPQAWRYRDYVISAYNEDLSYAQFLREQIAGDLLPSEDLQTRQRRWVATTFWMLGNINLEEQDKRQLDMDLIDEQLDVLGRGILAQTITCARCHDHKFDPIPTQDYYALAAILRNLDMLEHANVSKWLELPLPLPEEEEQRFAAHERAVAELEKRIQEQRQLIARLEKPASDAPPRIVAVEELPGIVLDDTQAKRVGTWQVSQYAKRYIGDGYVHDQNSDKGAKTITFQPDLPRADRYEVRLAYTPGGNRASNVPVVILSADGEVSVKVDQRREPPLDGHFVSLGTFRFEANGQAFVLISNEGTDGHVVVDAVQFLPVSEATPAQTPTTADAGRLQALRSELQRWETELKQLRQNGPKRPLVMTVRESGEVRPMRIHIRGNPHNLGAEVSRGFLQVLPCDPMDAWPADQSGRRQLADWLASPRNPLTARVYVNRLWHWLFGAGLVRSPDNFGTTGEPPTHEALLDYLTREFIEHDWSTKWLLRQLVLSRTYQQASQVEPARVQKDPQNLWWGRALRKRLDAECLRDAMLAAAGTLSLEMGGCTIPTELTSDYGYQEHTTRRSVYVPVFRNALPEIYRVFDFADPSVPTGARSTSTVAPQALYLMNHPFPRSQAEHAARRLAASTSDEEALIQSAFLHVLCRPATPDELAECVAFLRASGSSAHDRQERLTRLIHALFGSVEFRYVD